jgi:hypothetical protein
LSATKNAIFQHTVLVSTSFLAVTERVSADSHFVVDNSVYQRRLYLSYSIDPCLGTASSGCAYLQLAPFVDTVVETDLQDPLSPQIWPPFYCLVGRLSAANRGLLAVFWTDILGVRVALSGLCFFSYFLLYASDIPDSLNSFFSSVK